MTRPLTFPRRRPKQAAMKLTFLQVALGGALGATLRYLVNIGAGRLLGMNFPWGTVIVNILGSFVMGALVVILAHKDATRLAPFLMTGVLGGFTTFSAFSLDTMKLFETGQSAFGALYVAGTVAASLAAIVLGVHLMRAVFA